ncbi:PREDICTED: C-X-C chemokine receptor type 6 [Thamnophis sirtalis]|uniref:C-X-C chemokine receptor type 6 n=1 Tax=Thamnophis sirtalis TaxID=35019 RepID=A0A6I9XHU4_9SAUR|nr:PREDICTED: C-X-C chemokine receptor type 6 [Thamnophis sirtalis]XP_013913656.1 PREDICTED: C-X-C chemokine receptor type 6 [Thamnophis sirtalis]XP_032091134.1 C-X-C chemokine receptor type 6 [Thamnophis elegans]
MEEDDYYAFLSNNTFDESYSYETFLRFKRIFLVCMYLFACIFGVTGNSLVIIILVFYKKVKMLTDIFLVSLAIADFSFLCTLPFWAYSAAEEWIFYTLPCKIILGFYTLNLYGSMLTLTSITIDRYFVIVQATKTRISQHKRKFWGIVVCILIWIISLLLALPQFIFSTEEKLDKKICFANYSSKFMELFTETIQMTLGFFCPMLIMITCYSIIVKTLLSAKGFHKHKSLQIIFAIIVTFILTQMPYNLLKLIRASDRNIMLSYRFQYALIITEAIAYFHGCLNPLLYVFIGVKFRKNLAKVLKNNCCVKHQVTRQWQTNDENVSKSDTATNNAEETSMVPL